MFRRIVLFGAVFLFASSSLLAARERGLASSPPGLFAGPRHEVSAPVLHRAFGYQLWPQVIASDEGYLVIWQDARKWSDGRLESDPPLLMGTLVDANGEVRTQNGFQIANAYAFAATWNIDRYVIVYNGTVDEKPALFSVTFSRSGVRLSSPQPALVPASLTDLAMTALSDGTSVLIRYNENSIPAENGSATILDRDGHPVRTFGVRFGAHASNGIAVAAAGNRFVLVSRDTLQTGWRIRLMKTDGQIDTEAFLPIDESHRFEHPSITSDGDGFLLTWTEGPDLKSIRLDATAKPIDTPHVAIAGSADSDVRAAAVEWNGASFIALYEKQIGFVGCFPICDARVFEVRSVSLDANGEARAGTDVLRSTQVARSSESPAAATLDGRSFLAWVESTAEDYDSVVGTIDDAPPSQATAVSQSASLQTRPVVAADEVFAIAWKEFAFEYSKAEIRLRHFDASGRSLEQEPLVAGMSSENATGPTDYPLTIASGGGVSFVAWIDSTSGGRILSRMIRTDGTFVDAAPVERFTPAGEYVRYVAATFDGSDFLLAASMGRRIVLERINSSGAVLKERTIYDDPGVDHVAIHGDGRRILAVFDILSETSDTLRDLALTHDFDPIASDALSLAPGGHDEVSIDSDGLGTYLVAWVTKEWRNDGTIANSLVHATRVGADGRALDGDALSDRVAIYAVDLQTAPNVFWNGSNFEITFADASASRNALLFGSARRNLPLTNLPMQEIFRGTATESFAPAAMSSSGVRIIASEDTAHEAGDIQRVFIRLVSHALRRRAILR